MSINAQEELFNLIVKRYSSSESRKELYLDLIDRLAYNKETPVNVFICCETAKVIAKNQEERIAVDYFQNRINEIIPEYFLFNEVGEDFMWFNSTCRKHDVGFWTQTTGEGRMINSMNDMRLAALLFCVEMCS